MVHAVVIFGATIAILVGCSVLLGGRPRREREPAAHLRHGPDYEAMSEIESHDVEDMLDGINEYRRRTGRRALGDELADDFLRSTWDSE